MKPLLLFPFVLLIFSSNQSHNFFSGPTFESTSDSGIINHKLDGIVNEWPNDKFSLNSGTAIQYAVDNNGSNLFLALNIPDFKMQFKIMRMGMTINIDWKGKKKGSQGIEFPVKNENTDLSNNSISGLRHQRQNDDQPFSEQQKKQDMRTIRKLLALNLVEIKIFGLSDKYPDGQQLMFPGSANIAFSWDTADVMHIEYLIPLKMLGDVSSLNNKEINIGWKIHALEKPKQNEGAEGQEETEAASGENQSTGRRDMEEDRDKMMAEQKFWTKYTISFPAEKKPF